MCILKLFNVLLILILVPCDNVIHWVNIKRNDFSFDQLNVDMWHFLVMSSCQLSKKIWLHVDGSVLKRGRIALKEDMRIWPISCRLSLFFRPFLAYPKSGLGLGIKGREPRGREKKERKKKGKKE